MHALRPTHPDSTLSHPHAVCLRLLEKKYEKRMERIRKLDCTSDRASYTGQQLCDVLAVSHKQPDGSEPMYTACRHFPRGMNKVVLPLQTHSILYGHVSLSYYSSGQKKWFHRCNIWPASGSQKRSVKSLDYNKRDYHCCNCNILCVS